MRTLMFLALSLISHTLLAMPCSETPEAEKAMMAAMKKVTDLDAQGDQDFKKALDNLQKIAKMDSKQISVYAVQVATKPEFAKLQQDRQSLSLQMMSLLSGTDCKALKENNKKLQSTVSLQWLGVLASVQADTQVYLAKSIGKTPDLAATTDTGKKVLLHSNGTWSEIKNP